MDPRLAELIAKGISNLTPEELAEASQLIRAAADADPGDVASAEYISALNEIADAAVQVRTEIATRAESVSTSRAAILETFAEPAGGETADVAAESTPEPVAASARPQPVALSQVRQVSQPHREAPAAGDGELRASLTAAAGVPNNVNVTDHDQFLDEFHRKLLATRGYQGGRVEEVLVSSLYRLPDSIRDFGQDTSKTRAFMDDRISTLTASGGLCRPVSVDYSVPVWSNVARPVRDALPSFDAMRGGLQFSVPPVYSLSAYGAGVGLWSAANDASPGSSNTGPNSNPTGTGLTVKPCLEIDCASTLEVDVEAITQCVTISNFRGRFDPENVNAALQYLKQAWAATAEMELLRQMRAFAKHTAYAQEFGMARDSLVALDHVTAYFRDHYRLSDTVMLRVVLKSWVKNAIRSDLAKAAFPGLGDSASLAVTDAQITEWFTVRGLAPVWTLDDDAGDQSIASMSAGTTGSPVTLSGYPAFARLLIYPEGTFQLLDGGELNLGVVRDSALNAVNKYQVFSESFEAIAPRGFEAMDLKLSFLANGASAGTIAPA